MIKQGLPDRSKVTGWCAKSCSRFNIQVLENFDNPGFQIVLTTYSTLSDYRQSVTSMALFHKKFGLAILDEAHEAKNPDTKTSKHIGAMCADHIILLTATPQVNSVTDLEGLLGLLGNDGLWDEFPGLFRDQPFRRLLDWKAGRLFMHYS